MKILSLTIFLSTFLLCTSTIKAQKGDTIQITSANINSKVLREGTH
jgi:hypothetical protein